MDIKNYPYFKPLCREDLNIFNQAFKDNPPVISEFTFTNLYAWREIYKLEVAAFDDMLIVCSQSQKQKRFFSPIGTSTSLSAKENRKSAAEYLLKDTAGFFMRMPQEDKGLFENDKRFKIELDMDNSDYLYKTEELISLSGKKYDGKRNLIKKFKSNYEYEYTEITESNAAACLEFEETWCSMKDCDSVEGLNNERKAIRQIVENFSLFELIAGAIKVEGEIRAVAIGQRLNPDTLVMHVLKADPGITGLYQFMNNEFLSRQGKNFEYVNMEQDLGIEGLRKSKLSYHPVKMIKKYNISL